MHEVCWGLCHGLEEEDQGVIRHRSPLGWTSLLYSQRRYKDMKTEDIHLIYIYICGQRFILTSSPRIRL